MIFSFLIICAIMIKIFQKRKKTMNQSKSKNTIGAQKHLKMIQNLVDTIEENVGYEVNIIDLANTFGLSPWHFQRLFKTIVGDSLGGYTRGRRLSIAAKILLTTQDTIINVAFEVGFNSHESFTRSFKSYFKFSPKLFREQKPSVLINEKPLLTEDLLDHITKGMEQEPIIVDNEEQYIVGFGTNIPSPFTTAQSICEFVSTPWIALLERAKDIDNSTSQTFYGLSISPSGSFMEETLNYIAGIPVSHIDTIPTGMTSYLLPRQKVAIFDVVSSLEGEALKRTIDYIYGYWLPNSSYERGIGNDYELFENVDNFMTGDFTSKYVIPIV